MRISGTEPSSVILEFKKLKSDDPNVSKQVLSQKENSTTFCLKHARTLVGDARSGAREQFVPLTPNIEIDLNL